MGFGGQTAQLFGIVRKSGLLDPGECSLTTSLGLIEWILLDREPRFKLCEVCLLNVPGSYIN